MTEVQEKRPGRGRRSGTAPTAHIGPAARVATRANPKADAPGAAHLEAHNVRAADLRVGDLAVARSRLKRKALIPNIFAPAVPPRSVAPGLAHDSSFSETLGWALGGLSQDSGSTGFLGYPVLAELAQRPEYRRISEIIAMEMTRRWVRLKADGDEDKTAKIKAIEEAMTRLKVRDVFREAVEQDGFFGRGHIFLDFGVTDDREELRQSIGDGRADLSRMKVARGSLRRLRSVEAVWCYPADYNAVNPLKPDWFQPNTWFVQGAEVHASRLLTIVGREVPDLLKPAYSFGGLSLSQMAKPYVDNWLRTRQSVADLISSFSVFVLKTNLADKLSVDPNGDELFKRADFFNNLRDNRGLMLTDKELEDFANVSTSLATLDALQAQTQEHMASVSGIPLVKLLGIQPAGLNASSDGELECFYTWIHALQEAMLSTPLGTVLGFIQLSLFGAVDPAITFSWEPLKPVAEKDAAEIRRINADIGQVLIAGKVISPDEERRRIASDADSIYDGIAVDAPPAELSAAEKSTIAARLTSAIIQAESAGLVDAPRALEELRQISRTTGLWGSITAGDVSAAKAAQEPAARQRADQAKADGGTAAQKEADQNEADQEKRAPAPVSPRGGPKAEPPFDGGLDTGWKEDDHPRDEGGKFTSGAAGAPEGRAAPAHGPASTGSASTGPVSTGPAGLASAASASAANPRTQGVPRAASEVLASFTSDAQMKAHPAYAAAKAGNPDAAFAVVCDLVTPDMIAQAKARFGRDAVYAPIHAEEAAGKNKLPTALAALYADATGATMDTRVVQANRAFHTGAKAMDRMVARPLFAGKVTPGARYVIVDDVSVMGATIAEMAHHIRAGGGEVAGVVTLVNAGRSGKMAAEPHRIREIERRFGDVVRQELHIDPRALTADEAQFLLNFRDADALRDRIASARDERGRRLSSKEVSGGQAGTREGRQGRLTGDGAARWAADGQWREDQHPRDENGRFTRGAAGGSGAATPASLGSPSEQTPTSAASSTATPAGGQSPGGPEPSGAGAAGPGGAATPASPGAYGAQTPKPEAPSTVLPAAGAPHGSPRLTRLEDVPSKAEREAFKTAWFATQPARPLDDLYSGILEKRQAELNKAGAEIAAATGAELKDPGLKKRGTAEEKMSRKNYQSTARLADLVRNGYAVDRPEQADEIVRQLSKRFDVLDEGWEKVKSGYFDRKVAVKFPDGTIGEVQIWPRELYAAKSKEGKELYTARRSLPRGSPQWSDLAARERALYSAALSKSPVWTSFSQSIRGGGGGGGLRTPGLPAKDRSLSPVGHSPPKS